MKIHVPIAFTCLEKCISYSSFRSDVLPNLMGTCVMNFSPFNSFFVKNFINKKQMNGLIYSLEEYSNTKGKIQKKKRLFKNN